MSGPVGLEEHSSPSPGCSGNHSQVNIATSPTSPGVFPLWAPGAEKDPNPQSQAGPRRKGTDQKMGRD